MWRMFVYSGFYREVSLIWKKNNWIFFYYYYFLCLWIGVFVLSAFFLNPIYAGIFYFDPLGKQETRKIFFINKYQLCRGLNTDFAFTSSDLSLHCVKQRWAATHGIFWLLGRPMRPLKYSLPYPLRKAWYWLRLPMHFTPYGNVGGSSLSNRRFWGKRGKMETKRGESWYSG